MKIVLNGTEVTGAWKTVGEALAAAEEAADRSGEIVIAVKREGRELTADQVAGLQDAAFSGDGAIEVTSVPAKELKLTAYRTMLEFLELLRGSEGSPADEDVRSTLASYRNVFGGIVEADELSYLSELESGYAPDAGPEGRPRAAAAAEALARIFGERVTELDDPVRAMRAVASAFETHKPRLAEVPVQLQTGRDGEAVRSVLAFIELFNRTNRILPTLAGTGLDPESIKPDGSGLKSFYDAINGVLTEMMGAFERKDTVLLGDLVEYEIIPRMTTFYRAVNEALGAA